MPIEQGYPVTLVHPQHKPAKIVTDKDLGNAEPERYPGVTVESPDQEARYRALGYLRFGEAPPSKVDHHEFPKTLRHPKYAPETPARVEAKIENGRIAGTYTIPMVPAVFPDVVVLNVEQEKRARENGYRPAGEYDRDALEAVLTGTIDKEVYEPEEYPKWVERDGELVLVKKDPNAPKDLTDAKQYPKLINGQLIQDPHAPPVVDPHEFPKWVHRNGIPSDASQLANNPVEEAAIRGKWKREEAAETSPVTA